MRCTPGGYNLRPILLRDACALVSLNGNDDRLRSARRALTLLLLLRRSEPSAHEARQRNKQRLGVEPPLRMTSLPRV